MPGAGGAARKRAYELQRMKEGAPHQVFEPDDLRLIAHNYAGRRAVLSDPYAFPANGDLSGQPPILIVTSEYDSIRPSGEAYARAVEEAGGDVSLIIVQAAPHAALVDLDSAPGAQTLSTIIGWLLDTARSGG